MAKSPISFLQEFAMKQGYIPMYDFMTVNGKSNQFFCKVFCKDKSADATGNSKKEAKNKAAEKMLILLGQTSQVSMSSTISSLPVNANKTQNSISTMIHNTSSSSSVHLQLRSEVIDIKTDINKNNIKEKPSDLCINYIGLLQELCAQRKLSPKDISYNVVNERGPSHLKTFIMEVSVGSLRAQGTAQNKKLAKQEAAKNLLQNLGVSNLAKTNKNISNEILEENIQKLGIKISESINIKPILPIAELSEKAQSLYLERTNKMHKTNKHSEYSLSNLHLLFEATYGTKIPPYMKEKMQLLCINQTNLIQEIRQYIEKILELKIEKSVVPWSKIGYIISLRLVSIHNIIQIGIAETKDEAETQAMYKIITAISVLLN